MSIQKGDRVVAVANGKVGVVREIYASEEPAPSFAVVDFEGGAQQVAVNALRLASEAAEQLGVASELERLSKANEKLYAENLALFEDNTKLRSELSSANAKVFNIESELAALRQG